MRRIVVRCPLTGATHRVDQGVFDGRPEIVEDTQELGFVADELPGGWANLLFYVRVPNPEAGEIRLLREQAAAGIDEQVEQQREQAIAAGATPDPAIFERARNTMLGELDEQYPVPQDTVCMRYTLFDMSPNAVPALIAAFEQAGIRFVSPQAAYGQAPPAPPVPPAAVPQPATAAPAPVAPAAPAAPAEPTVARTPSTGAVIPEVVPAAPVVVPAEPARTPATGAAIPEVAPAAPAPAEPARTPATGAAIPEIVPEQVATAPATGRKAAR